MRKGNAQRVERLSLLLALLFFSAFLSSAQDTVTISKSRFDELQRKEAELEKLKGDLKQTKGENQQLRKQHQADTVKISNRAATEPSVKHVSPVMESLPPLKRGELVDAMDLANYYRADASAADHRFRKHTLQVQGEIVGFEKPPFIRDYKILLKTPDREIRVV